MKSFNELARFDILILASAVLLVAGIYLLMSRLTYAIGFPLDDAWIHQTYARNLALHHEWAFRPGIVSAGSTSPLWSAILSIGFLLHLSPYIWTYFLGALILFMIALVGEWGARQIMIFYRPRIPWVGLFLICEWHLTWAALSGMETLLHALLITTVLVLLLTKSRRYLTLGMLTGLSVWVRPDGLTLLGPALIMILIIESDMQLRLRAIIQYLIGFGALIGPYLLFNLAIGGTPMPNTFYAKQAEYANWQAKPILERLGQMLLQLFTGPSMVLFPAMIGWVVVSIKRRDWATLTIMAWCTGYILIYILRLPVYQHGRYIIPAMPILFLFGLIGMIGFAYTTMFNRYHWFVNTLWQFSAGMVMFLFIILGARSYAQDVAVIESEMVVTAKWVARNLPNDALVAAHDIGALGYYDHHEIIDLAGLISPEVIPFIRDEPRLAIYLNERGADYLIAFPEFYPLLTRTAKSVFVTKGPFAPIFKQKNMSVFRWESP